MVVGQSDRLMVIALAICIAALIASLAVLLKNPSKITEIAGGLVWAIIFTAALSYGLYLQLSKKHGRPQSMKKT